jgi:hypothetical protein
VAAAPESQVPSLVLGAGASDLNPSAARSLEEGVEETLAVHKLRVPDRSRRALACTNVNESAFAVVETVCRNVTRWRDGDHIAKTKTPRSGNQGPGLTGGGLVPSAAERAPS